MSRAHFALLAVIASTVMAVFGVAGHSRLSGPVLLTLTGSHGVHLDDLVVAACWLAIVGLAWRSSR